VSNDDRDAKGRFLQGNSGGNGRPANASKGITKDLTWDAINRIAWLIMALPEKEFLEWVEMNGSKLSRLERVYLNKSKDIRVLESLLDRIIGKTLKFEDERQKNPFIERLYNLGEGGVGREIDELLRAREIIKAEYKNIQPQVLDITPKKEGEDE